MADFFWSALRRYAKFQGRASRREFFLIATVFVLANLGANYLDGADGVREVVAGRMAVAELSVTILLFLPFVSAGARRLHDTGRSGWWLLLIYVPYLAWIAANGNPQAELLALGGVLLGFIALLVMLALPGANGPNRYGDRSPNGSPAFRT